MVHRGRVLQHPPLFGAVLSRRECTMATKTPPIPPLFKADAATLSFYGSNTGAVSVSYQGWDASKVVLEGERCCGGFRIEAVDPLLMTQGCNPLGHLWSRRSTISPK